MADFSTHKKLELPKSNEKYNVAVANKNNMVIDSELHKLELKNISQDSLLATKEELNREVLRATTKEEKITEKLNGEISRACEQEKILNELITDLTDVINNMEIDGTLSNDYTDDDKEIVWSFKEMTREETLNILNQEGADINNESNRFFRDNTRLV